MGSEKAGSVMPQQPIMTSERLDAYRRDGFVIIKDFFRSAEIVALREAAKDVFMAQLHHHRLADDSILDEVSFERALFAYFKHDLQGFINCGKTCQHLFELHRLGLSEQVYTSLQALGVSRPVISTRPVMYFNSLHLATDVSHYKTPPHQDWRSMQGSLNSIVVWVPLVDIPDSLGPLQVIPGSHRWGLLESAPDNWFRQIKGLSEELYVPISAKVGDAVFFSAFLVHQSGDNQSDSIRWSCHFRYNDLDDPTFVERHYPNPYTYRPQQELIHPGFPEVRHLEQLFGERPT